MYRHRAICRAPYRKEVCLSSGVQAAPPLTGLNEARQLGQVMAVSGRVGRGWFEGQELLCGKIKQDIMKM